MPVDGIVDEDGDVFFDAEEAGDAVMADDGFTWFLLTPDKFLIADSGRK